MIRVESLSFQYEEVSALKKLSFVVEPHDFIGIIGPNGAGKSTLLKCLSGFLRNIQGNISLEDKPLCKYKRRELAKKIAVVAQQNYYEFDFSVEQIVQMGRYPYVGFWQNLTKLDIEATRRVLSELEIERLANRRISEISGGEQQLVMLARALNQDTDILLLDEPGSHLDIHHQIGIFSLLKRLNKEKGKTLIVVSHNINLAAEFCDKILLMADGKTVRFDKTSSVIEENTLSDVYKVPIKVIENPFTNKPNIVYNYISN
jgi:iron complex transport system ATP-binding protein